MLLTRLRVTWYYSLMCPLAAAAAAMLAAMASLYSLECHQKGCDGICGGSDR